MHSLSVENILAEKITEDSKSGERYHVQQGCVSVESWWLVVLWMGQELCSVLATMFSAWLVVWCTTDMITTAENEQRRHNSVALYVWWCLCSNGNTFNSN